jgi:hypothetical protein
MNPVSKGRAIRWIIATIVTPLGVSMFFANVYVGYWYFQMANEGTPTRAHPRLP